VSELRALLFDVDGTLAETERDGHRVAFNQAFARAGLDWHWSVELYGELLEVTGGRERIAHYVAVHQPALPLGVDLEILIRALHEDKTRIYTRSVAEHAVALRPGVARLLAEARAQGLLLAIATTTSPANVIALLGNTLGGDSPAWFACIAAGDVVPAKKPAPDIYRLALDQLGLPASACLAFEDSRNGLLSANAAGLRTLVTVSEYTRQQRFDEALLVLDHLGEPDLPFAVLAGHAGVSTYVDVALLRRLHAEPSGSGREPVPGV
jgi:beta-phosphoglucomutase-like phosphatase (HAD superfamily)